MKLRVSKIFWGSATSQTPNRIWNNLNLFANASLCSNSSQYSIIFSQSLINTDFFYFWDRPWYSDECAWRLHYIPYLAAWSLFDFYVKQKQRSSAWSLTKNASFISFHGEIWCKYSEIKKSQTSKVLSFQN